MDENYVNKIIKIGNDNSNEQLENTEMSATQKCRSYTFPTDKKIFRLIDTPGIGDTRGIDQDKEHFENILEHIGLYRHLNGICILLKPNSARLNVVFRFCIQELLSHLHRNAKDNIVFCFTNARGTFYRPGDTFPALERQLKDLKQRSDVEIKLNNNTMYCFDNESFRFLAALTNGVPFSEADGKSFSESWERSVAESQRLLKHIISLPPHKVNDTLSLNNARKAVLLLSEPLAKIEQLILANISLLKEHQNEILNSTQSIEELKDKLYVDQIDLKPTELGYPRTVCTNAKCVQVVTVGKDVNIQKINYIKHCHKHCYLKNVPVNTRSHKSLRKCAAMKSDGNCKVCDCCWDAHMHIKYENEEIITKVVDDDVNKQIAEKKTDQEKKITIAEADGIRINLLMDEQEEISKINLKFAKFLRQNAIAAFNDAYADYLDHFINEERIKRSADPENYDAEILVGLENTRRQYSKEIKIIKQAIDNDPCGESLSPEDIVQFTHQLYDLPINGRIFKMIQHVAEKCQIDVNEEQVFGYVINTDKILVSPLAHFLGWKSKDN